MVDGVFSPILFCTYEAKTTPGSTPKDLMPSICFSNATFKTASLSIMLTLTYSSLHLWAILSGIYLVRIIIQVINLLSNKQELNALAPVLPLVATAYSRHNVLSGIHRNL